MEQIAVDGLVPYARNPRTHSDEQVAQIAASIREFGWTNPVLIGEDGGLIAGHGRLLAARKLGLADVPAIRLEGLTRAQKRALVIADNKLAINAGWDDELLRVELAELRDDGFDLALTGFDEGEMIALGEVDADLDSGSQLGSLEFRIVVDCASESEQRLLLDRFEREGLKCRALMS